jgi:hypothetical protein
VADAGRIGLSAIGPTCEVAGFETTVNNKAGRCYGVHELRLAGDAVGEDSHQGWAGRKIVHRGRGKGGIGPARYGIHREKGDLAVVDGAQLDYGIIG